MVVAYFIVPRYTAMCLMVGYNRIGNFLPIRCVQLPECFGLHLDRLAQHTIKIKKKYW